MSTDLLDKRETRIRRMFGNIAPRYDLLNHLLSLNIDCYWRRRTTRLAPPVVARSGDRATTGEVVARSPDRATAPIREVVARSPDRATAPILDVCTGTGDLALAYDRAAGHRVPIIGTDFCLPMLRPARLKARRVGAAERIRFLEADTQQLPFADDTFQLVVVAFGLRNVTDTDRGLAEMARVCKPGGRVAILEFSRPRHWLFGRVYRWYFRYILPAVGQLISRSRDNAYNYLPASVQEFPDGEALADRLRRHGLSDVRWHPLTFGIATLYVGTKPASAG